MTSTQFLVEREDCKKWTLHVIGTGKTRTSGSKILQKYMDVLYGCPLPNWSRLHQREYVTKNVQIKDV